MVFASECAGCGGKIEETEEKNHEVEIMGRKLVLDVAIVGRCKECGMVNYAFRKDAVPKK